METLPIAPMYYHTKVHANTSSNVGVMSQRKLDADTQTDRQTDRHTLLIIESLPPLGGRD